MLYIDVNSDLHSLSEQIDFTFHFEHLMGSNHFRKHVIHTFVIPRGPQRIELPTNLITHTYGGHSFAGHAIYPVCPRFACLLNGCEAKMDGDGLFAGDGRPSQVLSGCYAQDANVTLQSHQILGASLERVDELLLKASNILNSLHLHLN